ncbi:MAG: hypothetical protein GYA33_16825 [Thermogutta sp.]|nr:hypothetical protein [Thermogutta sp.]
MSPVRFRCSSRGFARGFGGPVAAWTLPLLAAFLAAFPHFVLPARAMDRTKGNPPPRTEQELVVIDEPKLFAAGIRKLEGRHLTLYTDLPSSPEVDSLCRAFDAAFREWCRYFGVEGVNDAWRMRGFLMADRERFRALGLIPSRLPPFGNGYSLGDILWLYEQPSDYYRRHLLLHEGTHGFVRSFFGRDAPPWYNEGIAELFGTHHWDGSVLTPAYTPRSPDEVPMWGRVKIVRDAVRAGHGLTLEQVLAFGPTAHRESEPYPDTLGNPGPVGPALGPTAHRDVEPYGWCWALAALLEGDPRFRERFRSLPRYLMRPDFTQQFRRLFAPDWRLLQVEWLLFTHNIEYGYSFEAEALDLQPGVPLPASGAGYAVASHRGWQNTGYRLEAGKTYRLTAQGRYTVCREGGDWVCEPDGVTIRYYRGKPLGVLLAALDSPHHPPDQPGGLLDPVVVGSGRDWSPPFSGTLFLRINDSPAELADNTGSASVFIRPDE